MYTQEKKNTEMSKTQSSALYKHMQQKGKLDTGAANTVCEIVLIGLRFCGWSLGLAGNWTG